MDPALISGQIDRILHSQSLASKGQLRKLLEILHKNMESQATLKPEGVIRELWPSETRTKSSADVATEINRLRHALESYYKDEGKSDPITIFLPNRSVHAPNGLQEKRWIAATPRGGIEEHPSEAAGAPAPPLNPAVPRVDPRRGLKIVCAAAAFGIVAFLAIRMLAADKRPQSGRLDGTTLTILNAEGKELWNKNFPDGFWRDYYDRRMAPGIWFRDLEGDGHTDVLLLYHPAVSPISHSTTLICYSDRGKERWRWTPGRALPELEGSPPTFLTVGLGILKSADGRPSRIVVSSYHQPFYPHQIAILDSNGKMLSEYWHSGHLDHLILADLDGDGRGQIVATGISNGYHQATLVVLDPDRVFGASAEPERPEIQLHGMGVAQERYRLLFHRSDLNTLLESYSIGEEATFENGKIRLAVLECTQDVGCQIWYQFDRNFHLVSALAGDYFRRIHKQFYLEHKVDHPLSAQEEAEFQQVRCLVGCKTEFVPVEIH